MALSPGTLTRMVVATLVGLLPVAGCEGRELDDARLVSTLRAQLDRQGVRADDLSCPDLPAQVGSSVRCTFTVDGQPVDAVATVSSVDGATVTYDVRWDLGQGRTWSYRTEAALRRGAGGDGPDWVLTWAPTVVHPQLAARQRFALSTTPAEPARCARGKERVGRGASASRAWCATPASCRPVRS